MTRPSKRSLESLDLKDQERIPLSPITSPPLSKRQEQNRAAQRAFRERRAQTLKEMETRLGSLEKTIDDISRSIGKLNIMERELNKLKETVANLCGAVDAMTVPTWTVPTHEELKPLEAENLGAVLNALRPNSTDPTLLPNE